MKKYEKIRIVQGVTIDCYCTEAPDAFFDRRYKCLLTGVGKNKDHFLDFLNNIPGWNDGIIIFNLYTEELSDFYADTNIPVLIVEKVVGVSFINRELPFSIIPYVNAEWIFLLDTNEKVIMGCNQLDLEAESLKDASFVSFHIFYTLDDINYYKHNLGEGIYKYRLFKKKYLMEARNDPDRIVSFAAGIIHKTDKPEEKDFSLLIPLFKIDEIYFASDGTIENAGKIYDENIYKLLEEDLGKIYRYLENESVNRERIGLYTGLSGKILFFIQLYFMKKDEAILFKAYEYLDIVLESIQSKKSLSFSFCDGLDGFGWLISYLQEHGLIEIPDDYLEDLDNILFAEMKNFCNHFLFDQMHQAISIGWYFIKRKKPEPLYYLIDALRKCVVSEYDEIKWKSYNFYRKVLKYDFGLAHGMAGMLVFFSKCYRMNICKDVCKNFIEGIFNFYLHNEQDGTKNKSFFPATLSVEDYIPGSVNQHIRLAWCYGDLGILYAIYLSGMYNNDVQMSSFALTRLRKSALRRDIRETRVRDAGFCHGSSSIAYIFNKMYYFTGEKIFKETALYWYKMMVVLGRKDQNSGEYLFFAGEDGWMEDTTLLNGVIGVGLSEISAFSCQNWSWDECVMLS